MKQVFSFLFTFCIANNLPAQNVGIGTNTPTEKLEVTGNIKADTIKPNGIKLTPNAGNGKILISDAAGVGTWQASSVLAGAGNIGYGVWGDCATNGNISEYQPEADDTGAANNFFGRSVSISGNYAMVGSPGDDVGANTSQGSVSIYQWDGSAWVLIQKITDATGAAGDNFGRSVSISGNYAMVGAYADDVRANSNQGSASIYQWNGSAWVLMQKITDATGAANDFFGYSVSISGNYAIAGAYADDVGANAGQGSASIYQWNGIAWVLMDKITDATGAADDNFGYSVSISGSYAIVGSHLDDVGANSNQGSINIYQRFISNWIHDQKITDANGAASDYFGESVSISGNYAIVGAYGEDVSANTDQGSASIYQRNGSTWELMQKITDAASTAGDSFGGSVYISGNYAIVGAPTKIIGGSIYQGAAFIYQRIGIGWQKLQYITDPGGVGSDNMGSSTSINGVTKRFIIGVPGYGNGVGKILFGKIN
jgi:FG-GAP repeat